MAVVPQDVHARIGSAILDLAAGAERLSLEIHRTPELAFSEHHAAEQLIEALESDSFKVTTGLANLPTAFRAEWGNGAPRIAYVLEYDALPGLGHGCGHNLVAAGGVTAARALRRALGGVEFGGSVIVIGSPGEEDGGGKVLELNAGVFGDIAAVLMFHPADRTIAWRHALACAHLDIEFTGKAAHAAKNPEDGRNALAAMIQFFVAVDGLRQHIGPFSRLHGIISHGGDAPNVVPDRTESKFLVRARTVTECLELRDRVLDCAHAAALATGTTCRTSEPSPVYAERRNNRTIAGRMAEYLGAGGVPVEPPSSSHPAGSSDIGNVSLRLPAIHPYLRIAPFGTPGHSAEFRDAAGSPEAQAIMLKGAQALARTGADLLLDDEFLASASAEFAQASGADLAGEAYS
jgi:amidohydrolase